MGRLAEGEKQNRENRLIRLLKRCLGLSEREIAEETGYDRRTANNYLRRLKKEGKVYKQGRYWQADD